jgi:predicted Zn finger-like uncharacterized protein
MIITCKECSTSFNLDEFLISADGSKVRCSKCKFIFKAYPPALETEFEEETAIEINPDIEISSDIGGPSDLEIDPETDEPSRVEEGAQIEFDAEDDAPLVVETDPDSDEVPDFEEPAGLEMEAPELEPAYTDFDSDGELYELDEGSIDIQEDTFSTTEADTQDSGEIQFEETNVEFEDDDVEFEESDLSLENDEPGEPGESDELTPVMEMEPDDEDLEFEEDEPDEIGMDEQISEAEDPTTSEPDDEMDAIPSEPNFLPPNKPRKKSSVGLLLVFLIILLIGVGGAYITSVITGIKIPIISDIKIPIIEKLFRVPAPVKVAVKPVPNLKNVNGRFVTNATAGIMFVITGRVDNLGTEKFSHIQIRGALITKGKIEAKTTVVYCGNIITEEILRTGNISDINKILAQKTGNQQANVGIKPGASVPFMIVFTQLPKNLKNFTVKVTTYNSAP